jgi:hypothetical protein
MELKRPKGAFEPLAKMESKGSRRGTVRMKTYRASLATQRVVETEVALTKPLTVYDGGAEERVQTDWEKKSSGISSQDQDGIRDTSRHDEQASGFCI